MDHQGETRKAKPAFSSSQFAIVLFIVVIGFFLWTEHRAHLFGALPYLILLLCPIIHIFMHRGHGKGH